MTRGIALATIILLLAFLYLHSTRDKDRGERLHVKYQYLVVDIVGPPDWVKRHNFSIRWRGNTIPLPVVFRVADAGNHFQIGARGPTSAGVDLGQEFVPITVEPDTRFETRNTGASAFIAEEDPRTGAVFHSVVTSVVLSPPEYPGELTANAGKAERERLGKSQERRRNELIAEGRLIEWTPAP